MRDIAVARELAQEMLKKLPLRGTGEWRIRHEAEAPTAFVFSYSKFVNDERVVVFGTNPVVVPKDCREAYFSRDADIEFRKQEGVWYRLKRWWIRRKY